MAAVGCHVWSENASEAFGLPSILDIVSPLLFIVLIAIPSLYGLRLYVLMFLSHRRRGAVHAAQREAIGRYQRETPEDAWPRVTTQIPLYNEMTVARRIIESVARLDYPRGRHEVQVLDDSTDGTRDLVDQVAAELRAGGYDVKVVRRPDRAHYKAGALAYGLGQASGEYIAIFDADFVPDPGFLRRMIPLIAPHQDVCTVQGRWGHLNAGETWITDGLSLSLDMHFAVEQAGRNWNGLLMSFNGTGGIWRKAAIEDPRVGGWSGDTITEDLDLSYRAQLAGWRMVFCCDEVCPAELPADVDALKTQQRRWATGSIQTACKLLPDVWRSKRLSFLQKVEATFHMTMYSVAVPMVLVALVGRLLPLMLSGEAWPIWLQVVSVIFLPAAVAPCFAYTYTRYTTEGVFPGVGRILKIIVLGLGLCLNNAVAVAVGLVQRGGEFVRTPKSGSHGGTARRSAYASLRSRLWIIELVFGVYCLILWVGFLPLDGYVGGTFMLLYAIGLILMGWGSRPESMRQQSARTEPAAGSGRSATEAIPASSAALR